MAKVGGGINNMHLTNGKAPGMKAPMPKRASSAACAPTACSRPGMRSANAAMKKK